MDNEELLEFMNSKLKEMKDDFNNKLKMNTKVNESIERIGSRLEALEKNVSEKMALMDEKITSIIKNGGAIPTPQNTTTPPQINDEMINDLREMKQEIKSLQELRKML